MSRKLIAVLAAAALARRLHDRPLYGRAEGFEHGRRRGDSARWPARGARPAGRRQRTPQRADRRRRRRAGRRRRSAPPWTGTRRNCARQLQGTGVSVTRVGDQIILNMPSDITFATDQDAGQVRLLPGAEFGRAGAATGINQTIVDVYGHTDSTGGDKPQFRPVAAPRAVGRQLSQRAGRRFAPLRGHRLRRDAADRLQRHAGGPGAEPPRRDPALAADLIADSQRRPNKNGPDAGAVSEWIPRYRRRLSRARSDLGRRSA